MQPKKNWFLRKKDGSEYGPVSLNDLLRWSAQCRVVAGNAISIDREEWTPVEDIPELEMHWMAHRADGKEYGPFALAAVQELFTHDVLPADAVLVNRLTGENKPLNEVIALPGSGDNAGEADRIEEVDVVEEVENPDKAVADTPPDGAEQSGETKADETAEAEKAEPAETTEPATNAQRPTTNNRRPGKDTRHPTPETPPATEQTEPQDTETATPARENRETEALRAQIEQLRQELLEAQTETAESTEAYQARIDMFKGKLLAAQNETQATTARLEALEAQRGESQQHVTDDLADLRKQTAFMKKNIAVLHAELDDVRRQSARRAKIVLVLGTLLTLIAALLILRSAGGCRPREDIGSTTGQVMALPAAGESGENVVTDGISASRAWPSLRIDGLLIERKQDHLLIRFAEGAFGSLTTLTPAASGQLKSLVERLRPDLRDYRLVVEGHTDDTPMRPTAAFADNAALAAARAETGAAFLTREGANAIATTNAGAAPYPNDTPDNRRRNRTLVIKLFRL